MNGAKPTKTQKEALYNLRQATPNLEAMQAEIGAVLDGYDVNGPMGPQVRNGLLMLTMGHVAGRPVVVFAQGQPGTGKTTMASMLGTRPPIDVNSSTSGRDIYGGPNAVGGYTRSLIEPSLSEAYAVLDESNSSVQQRQNVGPLGSKDVSVAGEDVSLNGLSVVRTGNFPDGESVFADDGSVRSRTAARIIHVGVKSAQPKPTPSGLLDKYGFEQNSRIMLSEAAGAAKEVIMPSESVDYLGGIIEAVGRLVREDVLIKGDDIDVSDPRFESATERLAVLAAVHMPEGITRVGRSDIISAVLTCYPHRVEVNPGLLAASFGAERPPSSEGRAIMALEAVRVAAYQADRQFAKVNNLRPLSELPGPLNPYDSRLVDSDKRMADMNRFHQALRGEEPKRGGRRWLARKR